jgi:hypothetical protein
MNAETRQIHPKSETEKFRKNGIGGNHRNLRTGSGVDACIYICVQDDKNDQKMMVLPPADRTRLILFILSKNIGSS